METTTLARPLPIRHKNEPCCAPAAPPRLSTAQTEALADRLKALADPTRLRMLDLLAQQEQPRCVCDITDLVPRNRPSPGPL
jgi:ArsR family transcriptional regulator